MAVPLNFPLSRDIGRMCIAKGLRSSLLASQGFLLALVLPWIQWRVTFTYIYVLGLLIGREQGVIFFTAHSYILFGSLTSWSFYDLLSRYTRVFEKILGVFVKNIDKHIR